jgi:hypothetical protein
MSDISPSDLKRDDAAYAYGILRVFAHVRVMFVSGCVYIRVPVKADGCTGT